VIRSCGPANLAGKTIIDACNPIADAMPVKGALSFFTKMNESLMKRLQLIAPSAHFVKAFSCVGNALMYKPSFEEKPTMFICGNNAQAKASVSAILGEFGWDVADMGAAEAARAIEPLCILWCIPGFSLHGQERHAPGQFVGVTHKDLAPIYDGPLQQVVGDTPLQFANGDSHELEPASTDALENLSWIACG
jgi:hypothetical protein